MTKSTTKSKFTYTPSTSPWDKQNLYILWGVEIGFAVFMSAFGGGMIHQKINEEMYDDGYSQIFYWL